MISFICGILKKGARRKLFPEKKDFETKFMIIKGEMWCGEDKIAVGINICTLTYIKQVTGTYSTG